MGYKLYLNDLDRHRLAVLLQVAEKSITTVEGHIYLPFTAEDVALAQKLRKMLEDTDEYIIITG